MSVGPVISIVLNAHLPFIGSEGCEERWFFEALSETYLPLLRLFDSLDRDHVPFRVGMSFSPTLCHMMCDELLLARYLDYVDRQIEFGLRELKRTADAPELRRLAGFFYDRTVEKRILFTERYQGNLLKVFQYYQQKGRLELLTTAATHAFLPFYTGYPEALQAQFEVASASHRLFFGRPPQGFWLPELAWTAELDAYLRMYNFGYTILEAHGLLLGEPVPSRGSFYPVKTPGEVFVLARDHYAHRCLFDEASLSQDPAYRDRREDVGFELPAELVKPFLGSGGVRTPTGYKYWASGGRGRRRVYDPVRGMEKAVEHARVFLDGRVQALTAAAEHMKETPICLCAYDADAFGRIWYEGPQFLEALFREAAERKEIRFMNPAEYLYKQDPSSFETAVPEFSSWGKNGYAEMWIDASNDWMYRHCLRAMDRMIEMAERFPDDSGLKERALNQAAREILLVQASDWPRMLYQEENAGCARRQIEGALRNFTTIYESLGSNYISTEWLTGLERRHNLFPAINYRIFRRKK